MLNLEKVTEHATNHSRKVTLLVFLVFLAPVYVVGVVFWYWLEFDDGPIYENIGEPATFKKDNTPAYTFSPGETMVVKWTYKRHRTCHTHYARSLRNSVTHLLRDRTREHPPVGERTIPAYVRIPAGIAPGHYEYHVVMSSSCNPVQRFWPVVYKLPPVPFEVKIDEAFLLKQHRMYEEQNVK